MLFNSFIFIFVFLPFTVGGFFVFGKQGYYRIATLWLVGASLFYYGWWNPAYVSLIVASILINYGIGTLIAPKDQHFPRRKTTLIIGIILNLGLLGYYKYANFFIANLNTVFETQANLPPIILPLAISFFTFQQIAYLIDTYQGKTSEYNFLHYCLFVTFFPQLIAGPIVHHKEMLPQFANRAVFSFNPATFTAGMSLFFFGLFKKVILADSIAEYATPVFDAASEGMPLTIFESWGGALSYTFQLYFDFSAYSDMAVGLGLMFGIYLPLNFYSPYKATSIIDFWRRWHITLSRFLRDYLYIPLGGSRKGKGRRYLNLLATMLLGGMWHGAGWTFILWGGLHGLYLMINHSWLGFKGAFIAPDRTPRLYSKIIAGTITFLAVVIAWVLFRAEDLDTALTMYRAMFGMNGLSLPESLIGQLGTAEDLLVSLGVNFNGMLGNRVFSPAGVGWLVLLSVIVWLAPNLQDIMGTYSALRTKDFKNTTTGYFQWKASPQWALVLGVTAGISVLGLSRVSEFLYFQF